MTILPWQVELMPIDRLEPHPENPRRGDVDAIRRSIESCGWYGAVVAQRSTGRILAGNHRWKAAREAGATVLPAILLEVDDDEARAILLADNRLSDLAEYDEPALLSALEAARASSGSLVGTGYAANDLRRLRGRALPEEGIVAPDQSAELAPRLDILIRCPDEPTHASLLARFEAEGLDCRALLA